MDESKGFNVDYYCFIHILIERGIWWRM